MTSDTQVAQLQIINGKLVRNSLNRLNVDGCAAKYASEIYALNKDAACVFCDTSSQDKIPTPPDGFCVFKASAPYQYWDGQEVLQHLIVTPIKHLTDYYELDAHELRVLDEYICSLQSQAPKGITVQPYTRTKHNQSKAISHVHMNVFYLGEAVVSKLNYTLEDGLTTLEFMRPSTIQLQKLHETSIK